MTAVATLATAEVVTLPTPKRCPACGNRKPASEFYRSRLKRDGRSTYCKPCDNARTIAKKREYRAALTPEQSTAARVAQFRAHLRRTHGITLEDARALLASQHGLCANRACGKLLSFDVHGRHQSRAVVDHCHRTGKVRGILCHHCNKTEGFIEKNKNLLLGLTEYLQRS